MACCARVGSLRIYRLSGGGERAVGFGSWSLVGVPWTSVLRWQAVGQSPGLMSHARTVYRPDLNAPPEAVRLQMAQSSL